MTALSRAQMQACEDWIRTCTTHPLRRQIAWIRGPRGVALVTDYHDDAGEPDGFYVSFRGHDEGAGGWYATIEEARVVAHRQTGAMAEQPSLFDMVPS